MKVLFLDISGKIGGAELYLFDIIKPYKNNSLVILFSEGNFHDLLKQNNIPVKIFNIHNFKVNRKNILLHLLLKLIKFIPAIVKVTIISKKYDIIFANNLQTLVIGVIASLVYRKKLVFNLHDILSPEHMKKLYIKIVIFFSSFAKIIIANSIASKDAFIKSGGNKNKVKIIYNGFNIDRFQINENIRINLRKKYEITEKFVIGNFSRISAWKGQHILIEALTKLPYNFCALIVGEAMFGEIEYSKKIKQQVKEFGLEKRVFFLGFRENIPDLISACDLIVHTSIKPEPFGRVIVEAMLCGKLVIATNGGGVLDIIENNVTGFLTTPGNVKELIDKISFCYNEPRLTENIALNGKKYARENFNNDLINKQINEILQNI